MILEQFWYQVLSIFARIRVWTFVLGVHPVCYTRIMPIPAESFKRCAIFSSTFWVRKNTYATCHTVAPVLY